MPSPRICRAVALLTLLAAPGVLAQVTDVPDLTTASQLTATGTATGSATTGGTGASTSTGATSGTTTGATTTGTSSSGATTTSSSNTVSHPSDLPTIAGAGIPTIVVPDTSNAPFMQKSDLPEGTVFIAVGAVLAFLGACVLLWRGAVAWSINRSVKRSALASMRGSEKHGSAWRPGVGAASKSGFYKDYDKAGSSMSLDALTSSGKPIKSFRDHDNVSRGSGSVPPAGLFFSPTANVQNRNTGIAGMDMGANRSSNYLPAGYYASPSAAQPAGGANSTTIGHGASLAPYARQSTATPSPPVSPNLPPSSHGAPAPYYSPTSREGGLRAGPRDASARYRAPSRDRYSAQTSSFYGQPSSSSLAVGLGGARASNEQLAGSRAPSAYLDDLFDHHGNGPRERF